MNEITYSPRENSDGMLWINGSRDRYGLAYFIARYEDGRWTLWENHRPHGINQTVATFDHKPTTWAEIDQIVQGLGQ
jgi:hypothetical protein